MAAAVFPHNTLPKLFAFYFAKLDASPNSDNYPSVLTMARLFPSESISTKAVFHYWDIHRPIQRSRAMRILDQAAVAVHSGRDGLWFGSSSLAVRAPEHLPCLASICWLGHESAHFQTTAVATNSSIQFFWCGCWHAISLARPHRSNPASTQLCVNTLILRPSE